VSTIIARAVNTIAAENPGPVAFLAAFVVALGSQARKAIHSVNDLIERRFAEFTGVPHQSPVNRQQWEELWELEVER
jgi:hypothetical protein